MAMTKAQMKEHRQKYRALMKKAKAAQDACDYRTATKLALSACQFIDGMMQFERRYEDAAFKSIKAIDVVLEYAPLLFDYQSLDELESLLKSCRRIEKNTSTNLADGLAGAKSRMWEAHRLWDHLELNPGTRQDKLRSALGGRQRGWHSMTELWELMGLLCRVPEGNSYRLELQTRMGKIISAKCPSCGAISEAPKAMLLEPMTCPDCRKKSLFVMLTPHQTVNPKD